MISEKEKAVLSVCIYRPEYFKRLSGCGCVFQDQDAIKLYYIQKELHDEGRPHDLVSITDEVIKSNEISVTRMNEIIDQYAGNISEDQFSGYVKELADITARNKIKKVVSNIDNLSTLELHEEITKSIQSKYYDTDDNLKTGQDVLRELLENQVIECGALTGYNSIDERRGGFFEGEMIIIAGRPGTGKTTILLNMIVKWLLSDLKVGLFSAEMQRREIMKRMISCYSGIQHNLISNFNSMSEVLKSKLSYAMDDLYKKNFVIDDTPNIDIDTLKIKAGYMKRKYDIDILGIDYLQLLKSAAVRDRPRHEQLGYISRTGKEIARSLKVPVVFLAQLNRENEKRGGGLPALHELKGSGDIEQDSDMVILLHESETYGEDESKLLLVIAKDRRHGLKVINTRYKKDICKIKEMT
jgi:replicative DNA helicase